VPELKTIGPNIKSAERAAVPVEKASCVFVPTIAWQEFQVPDDDECVLVTYANGAGSTAQVAEAIGINLARSGVAVQMRPVSNVDDISPYSAVVLGSAVRFGKWLPDAVRFIERYQIALRRLPVAYFTVSRTIPLDNPQEDLNKSACFLDAVRKKAPLVRPVLEGVFPGAVDSNGVWPLMRLMLRAANTPPSDFQDWVAIRAWTERLRPLLTTTERYPGPAIA
jgi:menaquinone-dependent protoporphyrinogen oxidase